MAAMDGSSPGVNESSVTNESPNVGLKYGLTIAMGTIALFSTIILFFYLCVKIRATRSMNALARRVLNSNQQQSRDGGEEEEEIQIGREGNVGNQSGGHLSCGGGGGVDESTLESYPTVPFSPHSSLQDSSCSICLADYKASDLLRYLPDCLHSFHAACIDPWLRMHSSCPICRTSPFSTPGSTPLPNGITFVYI